MPLICYLCSKQFFTFKNYLSHIRLSHAVHYNGTKVLCGQETCPQSFTKFRSLKTHLEKNHFTLIGSDTSYTIIQPDNCCRNMLSECSENHPDLINQETEDVISLTV